MSWMDSKTEESKGGDSKTDGLMDTPKVGHSAEKDLAEVNNKQRHEAVRVLNELVIEDFERLFELHEGDKVEARHRSGKYKAGKVYEDNVDRFTIRFRDGSKAKNLRRSLIRRCLPKGTAVEARRKNKLAYEPAVVDDHSRDRDDDRVGYTIIFDDKTEEQNVRLEQLRRRFERGSDVFAYKPGRVGDGIRPARISRVHDTTSTSWTYDLRFKDGEKCRDVPTWLVYPRIPEHAFRSLAKNFRRKKFRRSQLRAWLSRHGVTIDRTLDDLLRQATKFPDRVSSSDPFGYLKPLFKALEVYDHDAPPPSDISDGESSAAESQRGRRGDDDGGMDELLDVSDLDDDESKGLEGTGKSKRRRTPKRGVRREDSSRTPMQYSSDEDDVEDLLGGSRKSRRRRSRKRAGDRSRGDDSDGSLGGGGSRRRRRTRDGSRGDSRSDDDGSGSDTHRRANKLGSSMSKSFRQSKKDRLVNMSAKELRRKLRAYAEEEDGDLVDVFKRLDRDNKGYLRRDEFAGAVKKMLRLSKPNQDELETLMDCFDTDGRGHIDYSAFRRFVLQKPESDELGVLASKLRRALREALGLKDGDTRPARVMDLRQVFEEFDEDEGKTVERREFARNLRRLGVDIPDDDMVQLMDRLDVNGDKQISFQEFIEFVEPERHQKSLLKRFARILKSYDESGVNFEDIVSRNLDKRGKGEARSVEIIELMHSNMPFTREECRSLTHPFETRHNRVDYRRMAAAARAGELKRTNSGRLVLTEAGGVDLTATDRDKARQLKKQRKKLGLVNFAAQQLREAIWETVRRHRKESGVSERKALAKVFQRLDVQRTGYLGITQLRSALETMVSVDHVPKEDMKVLLECFDANNDGRIDFEEFESFVRWEPEGGEELGVLAVKIRTRFLLSVRGRDGVTAEEVFTKWDKGGRGYLREKDLRRAFSKLGVDVDDDDMQRLMRRFDRNDSGRVRMKEFCEFIDPAKDLRDLAGRFERPVAKLKRQHRTLESMFEDEDPRRSGSVTQTGFKQVVLRKLGVPLNEHEFRRVLFRFGEDTDDGMMVNYKRLIEYLQHYDKDGGVDSLELEDGDATRDDFFFLPTDPTMSDEAARATVLRMKKSGRFVIPRELIENVFYAIDKGRTGVLTREHLPNLLLGLNIELNTKQMDDVQRRLGVDSVSIDGFESIVRDIELASIGKGITGAAETALRDVLRKYCGAHSHVVSGTEFVSAMLDLDAGLDRKEAMMVRGLVENRADHSVSIPHFLAYLKRFAVGGCPRVARHTHTALALRKVCYGPLPDFDFFARVLIGLPNSFRKSVLHPIRNHPAHTMAAVLTPTVWSTEHDVEVDRRLNAFNEAARRGRANPGAPASGAGAGAAAGAGVGAGAGAGAGAAGADPARLHHVDPHDGRTTSWVEAGASGAVAGAGIGLRYSDILPDTPRRDNKSFFGGHTLQLIRPIAPAMASATAFTSRGVPGQNVIQTVLEIRQVQGVPSPNTLPLANVKGHYARVCLLERLVDTDGTYRYRFLGNQYRTAAKWTPEEPDLWRFGTPNTNGPPDNKLLIRTTYNTNLLPRLFVLIECNVLYRENDNEAHEIVCGWTYVALSECTRARKVTINLSGGSLHTPISLLPVLAKRVGMRQCTNMCTTTVAPSISLRISSPYKLPKLERHAVGFAPTRIIIPTFGLPVVRRFRESVGDMLLVRPTWQNEDWDWTNMEVDPFARIFCAVAARPPLLQQVAAFMFREKITSAKSSNNSRALNELFRVAIRRLWPLLCTTGTASLDPAQTVLSPFEEARMALDTSRLLNNVHEPGVSLGALNVQTGEEVLHLHKPFDVLEASWNVSSVAQTF